MSTTTAMELKITFSSDWHIGTGGGVPGVSDRAMLRDSEGFPYIPGRTLRGIFRDAHERLFALPHLKNKIPAPAQIWGSRQIKNSPDVSKSGQWRIGNARLEEKIVQPLRNANKVVRNIWLNEFTFVVPRIALDTRKRVKEDHLAFIEMGRKGLRFRFSISRVNGNPFGSDELFLIRLLSLAIQRLGGTRRRGKGRVEISIPQDKTREETLNIILGGV